MSIKEYRIRLTDEEFFAIYEELSEAFLCSCVGDPNLELAYAKIHALFNRMGKSYHDGFIVVEVERKEDNQ